MESPFDGYYYCTLIDYCTFIGIDREKKPTIIVGLYYYWRTRDHRLHTEKRPTIIVIQTENRRAILLYYYWNI